MVYHSVVIPCDPTSWRFVELWGVIKNDINKLWQILRDPSNHRNKIKLQYLAINIPYQIYQIIAAIARFRSNVRTNFDNRLRYDEICFDNIQWYWKWTRSLTNHFRLKSFSCEYARLNNIILRVVKMVLGLITIDAIV